MKNTKRSITFKVVVGYLLLAAMAALAVWFIYSELEKFSAVNQSNDINNQQLILVSEITTDLYETESTGRRFIQSGDTTDLNRYSAQIDDIQNDINKLKQTYTDYVMRNNLDSISDLLTKKSDNLEELLQLDARNRNTSFYTEVIQELEKIDESFTEPDYDERFANLKPHQRRVLINLLEFSEEESPGELTVMGRDSLVTSVKNVLGELERQNQNFRAVINQKEGELLDNDLILNEQLRKLLSAIDLEERQASLARVEESQILLNDISEIIFIIAAACILIILLFLILIVQDVSRSQQYRVQLEEAKSITESLMKRRERFMAAITHDLRSPLNTVIGYTELMGNSGLTNKQSHYLGHLKKSSEYILHLVNDLLDLSKLEAGKMHVEKLPFNPKTLLEETLFNTIPENKKDLVLELNAEKETDCQVLSDPFRIKQILSNLITNAYKFTETGKITASLAMKKESDENYILSISIKDTGIGISKSKQEEIFKEFSQEHGEIEKKYGGTGLGLAITKRITRLLKGNIQLHSEPGKGSEFIVEFPVVRLKDQDEIVEVMPVSRYDLSGKNILVVDDESSQLALSRELIKSVGMNCDTAKNGEEALQKLREKKYHLVLTDIQMPIMNGFNLLKSIKNNLETSGIPVIAVSGRTNVTTEAYTEAGFAGNMVKPYKPADLLQKIGEILEVKIEKNVPLKKKKDSEFKNYSLDEILLFAGEDQQALNAILTVFIESTSMNLVEIQSAFRKNNNGKISHIAHRMLPMFKQLDAREITYKLEELERNGSSEVNEKEITLLSGEIEALLKDLEKEIKA